MNKTFIISNNNNDAPVYNDTEIYTDISLLSLRSKNIYNMQFSPKVSRSINVKAVENSINNIFKFVPGERILNPEFGSMLKYYLYEGITDYNVEKIASEIRFELSKFDERVIVDKIQNLSSIDDIDDNTIKLRIIYHIKDLPDEYYQYDYSSIKST